MLDVPVENQDPIDAELADRQLGRDRDVVEQTEPHRAVAFGVMAGRAGSAQAGPDVFDAVHERELVLGCGWRFAWLASWPAGLLHGGLDRVDARWNVGVLRRQRAWVVLAPGGLLVLEPPGRQGTSRGLDQPTGSG